MRDELAARAQQSRLVEQNSESKMEAFEKQCKLQGRKAELEWEKKLRASQNQVQEAQDEARNSERTHRIELEAVEERLQELRENMAREIAREKEAIAAQLASGEHHTQDMKQMEQTFHHRELNFNAQIEDLTKALLESKQAFRDLTLRHDGVVADLTRERANMPIQLKVLKMEMATKVDVAGFEHRRLLANAEAEIGILKARLHLAADRVPITTMHITTNTSSESFVMMESPSSETPSENGSEVALDTENEPPTESFVPENMLSPKSLVVSDPSLHKGEMTSPRAMASPSRRVLKERTSKSQEITPLRNVRI
jgi:hypothetical protein